MLEKKSVLDLKEGDQYLRSPWAAPRTFIRVTGIEPGTNLSKSHHLFVNCFVHSGLYTEHNIEVMTADMQVYVVPKLESQEPPA